MSTPKRKFWNAADVEVKCPVGGHCVIGTRRMDENTILSCEDCDFDFYYKANEDIPTPKRHAKKKEGCGCGGCKR